MTETKPKLLERKPWQLHDRQVKPLLGLPEGAHLPKDGMSAREVEGVIVWVEPLKPGPFRLRVRAKCPHCSRDVALGRLIQHVQVHE